MNYKGNKSNINLLYLQVKTHAFLLILRSYSIFSMFSSVSLFKD